MRIRSFLLAAAFTQLAACSSSPKAPASAADDSGSPTTQPSGDDGGGGGSSSGGGSSGGGSSSSSGGPVTSVGGDAGGVPGAVFGPGTTIAGCEIFPTNNPWNVEIDGPDVKVITTYDSQLSQSTALHPDFGAYTDGYGIPFEVVDGGQPLVATTFNSCANESDPGPDGWVGPNPVTTSASSGNTTWPFYLGMEIEGDPSAGGTAGNLPGDQHGIVLQQGASGCVAYEAWNCVVASSLPFVCANGAVFHLDSNALRPLGWTSADAAGLSILAGLVRLSEVQAGTVTHAIRITFNTSQQGYILPATHAAGSQPLGSAYPPMGLRLRLKSSVSTSGYTTASKVIMTAMQKYGVIIADNGSDWFFQGDSNNGWNANAPDGKDTLIDEIAGDFGKLHGSDFEAIYSGDPIATGL
jgi:hypothetical protein